MCLPLAQIAICPAPTKVNNQAGRKGHEDRRRLQKSTGEGRLTCDGLSGNGEADPGEDLEGVVGARDQVEEESLGDGTLGGALGSQVAEHEMADEVAELGDGEDGKSEVDLLDGRGSVERVVDEVGHGGAHAPVVAGVLEDVEEGHGGMAEAMDEQGLELSLNVVGNPGDESEAVSPHE
jgi:hypothetical protein